MKFDSCDSRRRALLGAALFVPATTALSSLALPAQLSLGPLDAIRYLWEEVLLSPKARRLAPCQHMDPPILNSRDCRAFRSGEAGGFAVFDLFDPRKDD